MSDIYQVLNESKLTKFHYMILLVGCLIYCLTALDVMLIGSVVPVIAREWRLDLVTIGYLISSGFIGMFIGALLFGRLADVIGRRNTILIVIVVEALFTALCGLAYDVTSMIVLRLLAGIGLGGALPQPGIYVSEYVPTRYRGTFLGLIETSWVYGALLSLIFPIILLPSYGWRITFLVGLIPLIVIPLAIAYLPESIRYLVKQGRIDQINNIFEKYGFKTRIGSEDYTSKYTERKYSVRDLFSRSYVERTILLWILWASLVYTYYAIFTWLPTIYCREFHLTAVKSLTWVLIITLLQIPGYYSATFLLDKIGRKAVLSIYLIIAGIASYMLGLRIELTWILIFSMIISFFNLGAWAGLYTYTPELYPTEIRGTGSGAAASIGRLAGIIAPTLTGYLYSLSGLYAAYIVIAIIHIVAGLITLVLGIETKGRSLEELEIIAIQA